MKTTPLAAALAALLALAPPASAVAPSTAAAPWRARHVEGEVLVQFSERASARKEASIAARGHALLRSLHRGWSHVKVRAGESVEEALADYAADPDVQYAQPNYVYRVAQMPNDPLFDQLWGLENTGQRVLGTYVQPGGKLYSSLPSSNPGTAGADLNVLPAWDHVTDCSSAVVAVVDTGIDWAHEDLAENMWDGSAKEIALHGKDFVDAGDDDPMDVHGHGTHVAGIIGARGNDGIRSTGVCWRASLMAVRVLDASGAGTTVDIAEGVSFAIANGASVINMSLGGPIDAAADAAFADAIADARDADVVVVAAAGNEAMNDAPVYPCSFAHPNLICVAALDQSDRLATFSNYGATSVDVGAPGTNVLSTWRETTTRIIDPMTGWTGTSGWAVAGSPSTTYLVDPWNYPNGAYAANADHRVYKTFAMSADDVVARFLVAANVRSGDWLRFGGRPLGGDPFAQGGIVIAGVTDWATYPDRYGVEFDVAAFTGAGTSSFGFQLQSDASGSDLGVAITGFEIRAVTASTTSYNVLHGTSMAAPAVAGVAAMARTYNPGWTAVDVVEAIKAAGRPVAALAGKTTSGRAVDAMATLAHIRPPSNVTAVVR